MDHDGDDSKVCSKGAVAASSSRAPSPKTQLPVPPGSYVPKTITQSLHSTEIRYGENSQFGSNGNESNETSLTSVTFVDTHFNVAHPKDMTFQPDVYKPDAEEELPLDAGKSRASSSMNVQSLPSHPQGRQPKTRFECENCGSTVEPRNLKDHQERSCDGNQVESANVDAAGQNEPDRMEPRLSAVWWEDEDTWCYQVEVRGFPVLRREDNGMINGSMLLDVAMGPLAWPDISRNLRWRRDSMLNSENLKHVVKTGPMHLRGVWISFGRAMDYAKKLAITDLLYPLFVCNIEAILDHPVDKDLPNQILKIRGQKRRSARHPREPAQMLPTPPTSMSSKVGSMGTSGHYQQWEQEMTGALNCNDQVIQSIFFESVQSLPTTPAPTSLRSPSAKSFEVSLIEDNGDSIRSLCVQTPTLDGPLHQNPNKLIKDGVISTALDTVAGATISGTSAYLLTSPRQEDNYSICLPAFRRGSRKPSVSYREPRLLNDDAERTAEKIQYSEQSVPPSSNMRPSTFITQFSHADNPIARSRTTDEIDNLDKRSVTNHSPEVYVTDQNRSSSLDSSCGLTEVEQQQQQQFSPSLVSPQSDSETGTPDEEHDLLLRVDQKTLLLDRLMRYFFTVFSTCLSPLPSITTIASGSDGTSTCTGTTPRRTSQAPQGHGSGDHLQRRRGYSKEDEDEDEDHGVGERTRKKLRTEDYSARPRRLACPYFKKDPGVFQIKQSCSGPGWETVHRMKEHLDRNHALSISCLRCYAAFETERDRDSHMRSTEQCEVRQQRSRLAGFDASQRAELKARPRGYKQISEPQKWRHVYLILFPETAETEIPSPYYKFKSPRDPGHPVDAMMEYEQYLQREMPPRIREQLEIRIEQALDPLEEALRGKIVEIVRDVQLQLFQEYRSSVRQPSSSMPDGDQATISQVRSTVESNDTTVPGHQQHDGAAARYHSLNNSAHQLPQTTWSMEEELAPWCPEPYLDLDFPEFDGQLFDFGQVVLDAGNFGDSAYGTLSATSTLDPKSGGSTAPLDEQSGRGWL